MIKRKLPLNLVEELAHITSETSEQHFLDLPQDEWVGEGNVCHYPVAYKHISRTFQIEADVQRLGFIQLKFFRGTLGNEEEAQQYIYDNRFKIFESLEKVLVELIDDIDLCSVDYTFDTDHASSLRDWTLRVDFTDYLS